MYIFKQMTRFLIRNIFFFNIDTSDHRLDFHSLCIFRTIAMSDYRHAPIWYCYPNFNIRSPVSLYNAQECRPTLWFNTKLKRPYSITLTPIDVDHKGHVTEAVTWCHFHPVPTCQSILYCCCIFRSRIFSKRAYMCQKIIMFILRTLLHTHENA